MNEILLQVRFAADYVDVSSRLEKFDEVYDPFEVYFMKVIAADGPGVGAVVHVTDTPGVFTVGLVHGSNSTIRERVSLIAPNGATPTLTETLKTHSLDQHIDIRPHSLADAASHWNWPIRLLFLQGPAAAQTCAAWEPFVVPEGVIGLFDKDTVPESAAAYEALLDTERMSEWFSVNRVYLLQKQG